MRPRVAAEPDFPSDAVGTILFNRNGASLGVGRAKPRLYVVVWWAYQKPYYAVTRDSEEAAWTANLRNGIVLEVEGTGVEVKRVLDHWRRDGEGHPLPAEVREPAGDMIPALARRVARPRQGKE